MDLKQIKQDRENGVIVCRDTLEKLVDAALMMEDTLYEISIDTDNPKEEANMALMALAVL